MSSDREEAPDPREPSDDNAAESAQTWTIAEMAEDFAVTHRTLRHYEHEGLITPTRRGRQRVYHRRDRTRLELILRGRRIGLPLDEIGTIIDMYDAQPGEVGQLEYLLTRIQSQRDVIYDRLQDVQATLAELDVVEARARDELSTLRRARDRFGGRTHPHIATDDEK